MARQKKSVLPNVLIAVALLFAGYFALFGSGSSEETDPAEPLVDTTAPLKEESAPIVKSVPEPKLAPGPQEKLETILTGGDWRETRSGVSKLFTSDLSDEDRAAVASRAIGINTIKLLRDPDPRDVVIHKLETGDSLSTIARHYPALHGEWGIIALLNNIKDPHLLRVGKKLRIPRGGWSLMVDKSMFRMWLLYEGTPFKEYPIAIGKADKTPATQFRIGSKKPRPDWYPPAETGLKGVVRYGHKDNPLGEYWISLAHDAHEGFGIHGTNDDSSVGTAASNGCIRMHNEAVSELAPIAYAGMNVTIVE